MDFIGSTSYYVLCIIALVILVSALIILQVKPKSKARSKNTMTSYQQSTSEHIPKYAAGDDMDQINKQTYALWSEKKAPLIPIPFVAVILFAVIFIAPLSKHSKTETPQSNLSSIPTQSPPITEPNPAPTGELMSDFISAEYNSDRTKLFATYSYTNKFTINIYSIVATIELKDEDNNTIQTKVADAIESLKPDETKEITTSVTIEPNNLNKIKNVTIHTTFLRNR